MAADQHLRWSACCIIAADSELRVEPLLVGVKLIQGIEVRLGRSHHDVRIRPLTIDDASLMRRVTKWDRIFPLGDPPDYEPPAEQSIAARAAREGRPIIDLPDASAFTTTFTAEA